MWRDCGHNGTPWTRKYHWKYLNHWGPFTPDIRRAILIVIVWGIVITDRNSSCRKVIFSQARVILSVNKGEGDLHPGALHPEGVCIRGLQHPGGLHPGEGVSASRVGVSASRGVGTSPPDTVNERTVLILLECILVFIFGLNSQHNHNFVTIPIPQHKNIVIIHTNDNRNIVTISRC